jgi:hypothetical protein
MPRAAPINRCRITRQLYSTTLDETDGSGSFEDSTAGVDVDCVSRSSDSQESVLSLMVVVLVCCHCCCDVVDNPTNRKPPVLGCSISYRLPLLNNSVIRQIDGISILIPSSNTILGCRSAARSDASLSIPSRACAISSSDLPINLKRLMATGVPLQEPRNTSPCLPCNSTCTHQ